MLKHLVDNSAHEVERALRVPRRRRSQLGLGGFVNGRIKLVDLLVVILDDGVATGGVLCGIGEGLGWHRNHDHLKGSK